MRTILTPVLVLCLVLAGCDEETTGATDGAPPDLPPADLAVDLALADTVHPDQAPLDQSGDGPVQQILKAGAASIDITPGKGVPLGGFGSAPRRVISAATIPAHLAAALGMCYDPSPGTAASLFAPNTGIRDPLTAKALVLDNGKTMAAIVKIDAIGVSRKLRDDLEITAKSLGVPREHFIVSGTHTHGGAGAVSEQKIWEIIALGCLDQITYQTMLNKIRMVMLQAASNMSVAKIGFGSTLEKRVSKNRMDNPGKFDPELGLIKVVNASTGKPIAAALNFAVHGTCLGASNMKFSADLMGAVEKTIETTLGGGVALFLNGAEADVAPSMGGDAGIKYIGETLGATTAALWTKTTTKPWLEIKGDFADEKMPKPTFNGCLPLFAALTLCDIIPLAKNLPLDAFMQKVIPFGALRLGDVALAALPGEGITDVGLAVKAQGKLRGFKHTWVVGLANDFMGYIVTKAEFYGGDYEAQATMYGEGTAKLVIDNLTKRLEKIKLPAATTDAGSSVNDAGSSVNDAGASD